MELGTHMNIIIEIWSLELGTGMDPIVEMGPLG